VNGHVTFVAPRVSGQVARVLAATGGGVPDRPDLPNASGGCAEGRACSGRLEYRVI
jgi:hypothetical protein